MEKQARSRIIEDEEEEYDDTLLNYAQYNSFIDVVMGEDEDTEDNDVLAQILHEEDKYRDNEKVRKKVEYMLEDHNTFLYLDCKNGHKKLRTTLELLQWKAINDISGKAFNEILSLIKKVSSIGE
jgi:hypothetical protein